MAEVRKSGLVYVTQYGGWWSVKLTDWHELVRSCKAGDEYDLDAVGKELKRRPAKVFPDGSAHTGYLVAQPLDWDKECWTSHLEFLESEWL